MKYWVYINDKVDGPYDGEKLVSVPGFTPETLICSEESASNGSQDWVKASSVFEFEQEPQPAAANTETETAEMNASTALLLEKLETLTREISGLHTKLDSMENHIESVETILAKPPAPQAAPAPAPAEQPAPQAQSAATQDETAPLAQPAMQETTDEITDEKIEAEDAMVISSALDSLYNAKLIEEQQQQDENETTFQDLLTPQQAKELGDQQQAADQAENKEQTDGKEALLAALTAPAAAAAATNVLDQLIQEKQAEQAQAAQEQPAEEAAPVANDFALQDEKVVDLTPPADEPAQAPMPTLDDIGAATQAEEPAQEMPAEQAQKAANSDNFQDLVTPMDSDVSNEVEEGDAESEATLQELVPNADNEPNDQLISAEDLRNAFSTKVNDPSQENLVVPESEDEVVPAPEAVPAEETENAEAESAPVNPNELTEVELKAGSTYLISDFVPPAQTGEEKPAEEKPEDDAIAPTVLDKTAEVQDMLAEQQVPTAEQLSQTPSEEIESRSTKRGASFDIKTVPMVAEPAESDRLHVDGLDDVNAQHDVQLTNGKSSGVAKTVITVLVSLALLIILYVLLAFMNLLPKQYNVLAAKEKATPAAQSSEMMLTEVSTEMPMGEEPSTEEMAAAATEGSTMDEMLAEVQQYMLPNGQTLKSYVETVHATISPELITWEITDAVEPDNYSVLVKVPPEDPQSFKTSYRFNYNAANKTLDPTISDAKNLLDGANVQEVVAQ